MPIDFYSLSRFPSSPPPRNQKRCPWKGCIFPRQMGQECAYHARFFYYCASLTGRHVSSADVYDDNGSQHTALYISRGDEIKQVRVVFGDGRPKDRDPYSDPTWGKEMSALAQRTREYFGLRKPLSPGRPNLLTVDTVVFRDGARIPTTSAPRLAPGTAMANHNSTGAFILWKGFGKKKIRKSQRNRPAGWHGSHPKQKPMKVSRETLNDIPVWTPGPKDQVKIERSKEYFDADEYERDQAIAELVHENFDAVFMEAN